MFCIQRSIYKRISAPQPLVINVIKTLLLEYTVKKNRKFFRTITGLHRAFRLGVDFYPMDTYPTVFGIGSNYIWIHIQLLKMT